MSNYRTQKANFRGNASFGRTTQLVDKSTGVVVLEVMGAVSKKDLVRQYEQSKTAR